VLFGRTRETQRHLARAFRDGTVHKRYRALLAGTPDRDRFVVDVPIGPVPHPLLGSVHAADPAGRPSSSTFTILERRSDTALADVVIGTGRPHQIRIHAAACGHPLAGDPLYAVGGRPADDCRALPGDPGYLLHAAELRFPDLDRSLRTYVDPPPVLLRASGDVGDRP
jgi:23S rRNA pseudouridine1911/1915/1917 synthase